MRHVFGWPLLVCVLTAVPASAGLLIVPTFDSSITSMSNAAQVETAITTAINALDSLYVNNGTVPVLFEYNPGLNGGAQTESALFTVSSYSSYVSVLSSASAAHPANTTFATAVANLPSAATLAADFGATPSITVTAPFADLVLNAGQFLCFDATGGFHNTCGQSYEAVVTVSAPSVVGNFYTPSGSGLNSTAVSAVEHELDEVLGGGGAGTTLTKNSTGNPTSLGPLDLYRYRSTGSGCTTATGLSHTLSWSASSSTVACLSIDGGKTSIAQFNQVGGGSDYGDWAAPVPAIQDAFEPGPNAPVYSPLSPEFGMMLSIGYDAPEPPAIGLFVASVLGLGWMRLARRGRRGGPRATG